MGAAGGGQGDEQISDKRGHRTSSARHPHVVACPGRARICSHNCGARCAARERPGEIGNKYQNGSLTMYFSSLQEATQRLDAQLAAHGQVLDTMPLACDSLQCVEHPDAQRKLSSGVVAGIVLAGEI